MNSKLLIKQNRELFDKLQIANLNCRRLTEENVALKEKIQFLTEQLANKKEEDVIKAEEAVVTDEVVAETVEREAVELSPEIEYGSKIIGEIVMSATYHSNLLGTAGKDNLKELLNLILGRTEVAKSQILNIVSSDVSIENKMQMIDSERDDAIEYFKSIMEQ
ncbi:MAG: hypothetical protein E7526_00710 [Ruminococcaceae bacterium]|nr:hypothetical protein [Oscillospiraceae bacterium]